MKILKQHLFLDTIGIESGGSLAVFDPNMLTVEGKEEVEQLIHTWGYPAKYGKTHIESRLMPYGVKIEPENATISMLFEDPEPWEELLSWASALYDPEDMLYKLWYGAKPSAKNSAMLINKCTQTETLWETRLCYAYSKDGLTWIRPELSFFLYDGRKTNMLDCCVNVAEGGILMDLLHKETGKFKTIVLRSENNRSDLPIHQRFFTHIYTSDDGINWFEMDIKPLNYFFDTQNIIQYDEGLSKYVAYMRGHYNGRAISRCEFEDPAHMPMPNILMHPDNEDPMDVDYYNSCFTFYPHDRNIRLMFPSMYSHRTDFTTVRMAVSRNGRNFQWVSRDEVIKSVLPDGEILGTIYASPGMLSVGNRTELVLVTGNIRHDESWFHSLYTNPIKVPNDRLRIASWENDRLAGLVAKETGEVFVSVNISGQNPKLQLNLRSEGQGRVRVEICHGIDSEAASGYALKDSDGLRGDLSWTDYCWAENKNLSAFDGQQIELCLHIENAKLFGYRIVTDDCITSAGNEEERIISVL